MSNYHNENSMNGIINVKKEKGFTSFDVVAKLRGILHEKKIGHTGTLDPDATGVLPVCIGKATKVCELLTDKDKVYEAVLLLGKITDTQDLTGEVLSDATDQALALSEDAVQAAIQSFVGDYDQVPPMYSALKVNGKKLYEYARAGVEIERKARRVHIFDIAVSSVKLPEVTMRVHCSKGTYIRTLCADIGEKLGVGGCMASLLRTKVSVFDLEHAHTLAEIEQAMCDGTIADYIVPIDHVFSQYPALTVNEQGLFRLQNGNRLRLSDLSAGFDKETAKNKSSYRIYDDNGRFYAIYSYDEKAEEFVIVKMFDTGR